MNARHLNVNANGYINYAAPDSPWITDGAMLCLKEVLPANVVKQWTHPRRFVNPAQDSRHSKDEVIASCFPSKRVTLHPITTQGEIPPARYRGDRDRIVPNGVDYVTFDAPCFLALQSVTDEARMTERGPTGTHKAIFYKGGKPVALLMGQRA